MIPDRTKLLLFPVFLLLAAGCMPSAEEKTREVITRAMWESLTYPGTFIPVESSTDSVWAPEYLPDAVDIRRTSILHRQELDEIEKKLLATEETMRLWRATPSPKSTKKIQEAVAFHDRIRTEYDSVKTLLDGENARLDSIGRIPRKFIGHLVDLRYVCVTEEKDTVFAREYLLLDSTKTAVIRQWKEKEFARP